MATVIRRRPEPSIADRPAADPAGIPVTMHHDVEAPDAGEGRAALLEHEFTHGRSQS